METMLCLVNCNLWQRGLEAYKEDMLYPSEIGMPKTLPIITGKTVYDETKEPTMKLIL